MTDEEEQFLRDDDRHDFPAELTTFKRDDITLAFLFLQHTVWMVS